jgi:myxalamid-type polyketide synthase MxaE and MxaD
MPANDDTPLSCRSDASYLITGGLGLLGLKVARYLAACGARHLILVARHGLPEPASPVSTEADVDLHRRIAAVQALEAEGVTVQILEADVADQARMRDVFAEIARSSPPVRGIVHAASAMHSGRLADLSRHDLFAMLEPKLTGTWILDRLSAGHELDFFVLFSSLSGLLGSMEMGHYAAANAFLDGFAHARRSRGKPAVSISWGSWDAMRGSADRQRLFERSGVSAMDSEDALAFLGRVGAGDTAHVAIADVDWATFKPVFEARGRRPFLDAIDADSIGAAPTAVPERDVRAELVAAPFEDRPALLRMFIREEAALVLGLATEEIDVRKGLFDLGMDSLMSVELKRRLEVGFAVSLPATLTFKYPTVTALAKFIDSLLAMPAMPQASAPTAVRALDDDMSEAELAALLAERLEQIR